MFAITLKDPESVNLNPPSNIRLANALSSARGYIGQHLFQSCYRSLKVAYDQVISVYLSEPGHPKVLFNLKRAWYIPILLLTNVLVRNWSEACITSYTRNYGAKG